MLRCDEHLAGPQAGRPMSLSQGGGQMLPEPPGLV